jgi:hypothetical protein
MFGERIRLKYQQITLEIADESKVLFCMWDDHLDAEF